MVTHGYKGYMEWILDSECSFHMTPHKVFFSTYEKVDDGNVTLGNDDTYKVVGIDSVAMK